MVSAGAGTGKTYNIQILALRCILTGIPIDKILVVTYTNLATAELQDRLRRILQNANRVSVFLCDNFNGQIPALADFRQLSSLPANAWLCEDDIKQVLPCFGLPDNPQQMPPDHELSQISLTEKHSLLEAALRDFDNAPISTIHGFCSRILRENAFETSVRYGLEMRKSCRSLIKSLLGEFYRKFNAICSTDYTRPLLLNKLGITPDSLQKSLKDVFANPDVPVNFGADLAGQTIEDLEGNPCWKIPYQVASYFASATEEQRRDFINAFPIGDSLPDADLWKLVLMGGEEFNLLSMPNQILNLSLKQLKGMAEYTSGRMAVESPGDDVDTLAKMLKRYHRLVICQAFAYVRDELEIAKVRDGFMTYDDLLLKLKDKLTYGANREKLRQVIQDKYYCVMIDEFQDTDSNQSAIFDMLFENGDTRRVKFMIGDEKQAIYMFRGGDVQTFQSEKNNVSPERCYTLSKNFRSSVDFINCLNKFRTDYPNFFEPAEIAWEEIEAARTNIGLKTNQGAEIIGDELLSICRTEGNSHQVLASEIKALASGKILKYKKDTPDSSEDKPVKYSDIAILVSHKKNVESLRECLQAHNIPSVFMEGRSIFCTAEGQWLQNLLDAIIHPGDQGKAMRLLGGRLFSFSPAALELLHEYCLPDFQMYLKDLHAVWENKSFYFMFNKFLNESITRMMPSLTNLDRTVGAIAAESANNYAASLRARWSFSDEVWQELSGEFSAVLNDRENPGQTSSPATLIANASADGLRSLSLLLQLAETLMKITFEEHLGQLGMMTFLEGKLRKNAGKTSWKKKAEENATVDEDDDDDEEYPVHLTSQDDAVRILTIHKSKGLQFPFVFVPDFSPTKKQEQNKNQRIYHQYGHRIVNLDDDDEQARRAAENEKFAERRRLMYVAVTRAIYMCRFITTTATDESRLLAKPDNEARHDLFLRRPEFILPHLPVLPCLESYASPAPAATSDFVPRAETIAWKAAELFPGWITTSFTQVSKVPKPTSPSHEESPAPPDSPDALDDVPAPGNGHYDNDDDDDEIDRTDTDMAVGDLILKPYAERSVIFRFPGGKRTGTCWHEIFEHLDFTKWAGQANQTEQEQSWADVLKSLEHYGQLGRSTHDAQAAAFRTMLRNVSNCPLNFENACLRLCDIPQEKTRREYNFTYKVKKGISGDELRQILWDLGKIAAPPNWSHAIGQVNLTGSIDLLFQAPQNGKFYIIDWKTNIIGADEDNFTAEGINAEMDRHFYKLQCVLYALAFIQTYRQFLHNPELAALSGEPLDAKLKEYCREAYDQFGGCADIFVRGVDELGQKGVYYLKPSFELLAALDRKIGVECPGQKEY